MTDYRLVTLDEGDMQRAEYERDCIRILCEVLDAKGIVRWLEASNRLIPGHFCNPGVLWTEFGSPAEAIWRNRGDLAVEAAEAYVQGDPT